MRVWRNGNLENSLDLKDSKVSWKDQYGAVWNLSKDKSNSFSLYWDPADTKFAPVSWKRPWSSLLEYDGHWKATDKASIVVRNGYVWRNGWKAEMPIVIRSIAEGSP